MVVRPLGPARSGPGGRSNTTLVPPALVPPMRSHGVPTGGGVSVTATTAEQCTPGLAAGRWSARRYVGCRGLLRHRFLGRRFARRWSAGPGVAGCRPTSTHEAGPAMSPVRAACGGRARHRCAGGRLLAGDLGLLHRLRPTFLSRLRFFFLRGRRCFFLDSERFLRLLRRARLLLLRRHQAGYAQEKCSRSHCADGSSKSFLHRRILQKRGPVR